jgi:Family of unknown function (DUF6169)
MTTLEPYNFKNSGQNTYTFATDNNVLYGVDFSNGSYYFARFPEYMSVFEISINVLSLGDNISPPNDKKVESTIVQILANFLSNKEDSIIYICQNLDNRHYIRKRKFDLWFNQNQNDTLEKHDLTIDYEDIAYLTSLIVHKENSHKDEIIALFFDQSNQYNK